MHSNFTRGIIAGTILGITLGIIMPKKGAMRMSRRFYRNGRSMVKRAGSMLDNMIDIW